MVAYLTGAMLATMTRRERLCELVVIKSLLNRCARLDTGLHLGPDLGLDLLCGIQPWIRMQCAPCGCPKRPGITHLWDGVGVGRAEGLMVGVFNWWLDGCAERELMGESLKRESGWVHMIVICLNGIWVCVWDGPWRLSRQFLRWISSGRCGMVFGWKFPDGPRLGNLDGLMVGKWKGQELGSWYGGFLGDFQLDLSLGKWKCEWLENLNGPQLSYVLRIYIGNSWMDPSSVTLEEIWLETVRVMCLGHQMEDWLGGHWRRVARSTRWVQDGVMSKSWVCDGLIGRQHAQRCRNQGCWLILTETPELKDEICCWM